MELSAQNLFKQPCNFVLGVQSLVQLPESNLPEIAFAGRSNVGKSSLINAVLERKGIARASNTPGRTQQLNFFNLANILHIVDLPGYGFANAPKKTVKAWESAIFNYLRGRPHLKRVFLLIDTRHGIKKTDTDIMNLLDKSAVIFQIVLTKADKCSAAQIAQMEESMRIAAKSHGAAYPEIIVSSSETGLGIKNLQQEIFSLVEK